MTATADANTLALLVGLATLRAAGATHVVVGYSGSDDSGGINGVRAGAYAPNADDDDDDPALTDEVPLEEALNEMIETWAWDHAIPRTGWENNEGGRGNVRIDLTTFEVVTTHVDRAEDEEASEKGELSPDIPPALLPMLATIKAQGYVLVSIDGYASDGEGIERQSIYASKSDDVPQERRYLFDANLERLTPGISKAIDAWFAPLFEDVTGAEGGAHAELTIDLTTEPPTAESNWSTTAYSDLDADVTHQTIA